MALWLMSLDKRPVPRGINNAPLRVPQRRRNNGGVMMTTKVRVNLANPLELLELPGVGPEEADAIRRFRAQHGPIRDAAQLVGILGGRPVPEALSEQADFSPSEATAPEAPGA
jgi:hypothetical protein